MPVIPVVYTEDPTKVYRQEQNRRVTFNDFNVLSGFDLTDSNYLQIIKGIRDIHGLQTTSDAFIGGKVDSYTLTAPAQITTKKLTIIKETGIYRIPPITLTIDPNAYWGFFELELLEENGDPVASEFYDGLTFSFTNSDTRKYFRVKVYENYNTTNSFPSLTAGRIKWIEYKKSISGALGVLVDVALSISTANSLIEIQSNVDTNVTNINNHIANTSNPHSVTKTQIGLGNVTNDAQIPLTQKGAVNGVASLDGAGQLVQNVDWSKILNAPATNQTTIGLGNVTNDKQVINDSTNRIALSWDGTNLKGQVDANPTFTVFPVSTTTLPYYFVIASGDVSLVNATSFSGIMSVIRSSNVCHISGYFQFTKAPGTSTIIMNKSLILTNVGLPATLDILACGGTVSHNWNNAPQWWGGFRNTSATLIQFDLGHGGDLTSLMFYSGFVHFN